MPIEQEKLYFHSNFHKIRLKNEFVIAINVFFSFFFNALTFLKIKMLQKELHHSVRK